MTAGAITTEEYHAKVAAGMKEKVLQERVREYARELVVTTDPSLLYYHTHRSTHSPAGFPDVYLVSRSTGLSLVAELKTESARSKPSKAQMDWLDALSSAGVPAFLWRPRHWMSGEIQALMLGVAQGTPLCAIPADSRWGED